MSRKKSENIIDYDSIKIDNWYNNTDEYEYHVVCKKTNKKHK